MNPLLFILLLVFGVAALVWIIWDFVRNLLMVVDPQQEADRLLAKRHDGDAAGLNAARARFDANRARNLSAISIAGIVGMLGTVFIVFG